MTASSRFFDRLYVGGLLRPTLRGVAYAASAALVVTIAPISDATPTATPITVAAAKVPATKVTTRPDVVSARVAARAQGARVEVEQLRTTTSSTWVNPDGTFTTEQHQGPVRFKDPSAKDPKTAAWVNVNLDVEAKSDGTAGPVAHPGGLSLAGKTAAAGKGAKTSSGTDAVSVDEQSGRAVTLAWPGALGEPVLKGTSATYREVLPGVDFVVHSRRTGFESDVVIKSADARDALLAKAGSGPVSFSFPLKTKGLTARAEKDGSVSFVDAKGAVVSAFSAPIAWDAKFDPASGNWVNQAPVAMTVAQENPGTAVLTLTPAREWLAAADRMFPVTIDPTYASGSSAPTFDTFVSTSWGSSTTPQTMAELRVGTYNGGGDVAYSYLNFPVSGMSGKDITTSNLSLFESYSFGCTPAPVTAHRSGVAGTGTTFGNQPAQGTLAGSVTVAKGNTGCAAGRISVPITPVAREWAAEGTSTGTLKLSASTTDNNGWKKFHSMEASYDPVISYSYNRRPNAAVLPSLPDANTYTPPGGSAQPPFTKDATPKLSSTATDPDGSAVSMTFEVHKDTTGTTKVTSCATPLVTSGSPASCSVPTLEENAPSPGIPVYYARAAVKDDRGLWNGTWSPWRSFYVQTSPPPAPVVACDNGYATSGTWTDTDPGGTVTCTVKAYGTSGYLFPAYLDITVDGVVKPRKTIPMTTDPNLVHDTFTFQPEQRGYHEIKVTALGRSLVATTTTHGFGWGEASMIVPTDGTTSSGKVKVSANGAPRGSTSTSVSAKVQWRVAASGNETTGWTDSAAGSTLITPTSTTVPAWYGVNFDLTTAVREAGATADVPSRTPVRLDVQVCFIYGGTGAGTQCTWSQSPVTVTRLPHAFGAGYPVTDAGVGQLAQYTGEISLSGTDVSVPGYTGDISISRSHTSFAGDGSVANWPSDAVTGVFGPGFTANLDGGEAGLAGLTVVDNTRIDGSIVFMDEDGEPLVYTNPAGTRTYPAGPNTAGTVYDAGTDDTEDSGTVLKLTGTGTATVLTLTEEDGTATTWKPVAAPSTTSATVWKPDTISEPGQAGKTTFGHDATGRVTRIVAPVPDGMAGSSCPTTGTLAKGCRALDLVYEASLPGLPWRVKEVRAQLWNPATPTATTTTSTVVATYLYDTSGRLVNVSDPRTGLGTTYTWHGTTTRIASMASASMAATKLTYDIGGRLTKVSKDAPVAGGGDVVTNRYVYDVPTSGSGLPTVSDAVTAYRQAKAPVTGFATFGQDYTGPDTPTSADWVYADLSYVDDLGYTVNTATYGAGAWLVTSTDYDAHDNVIRTLDASATQAAADIVAANPGATPETLKALTDVVSTQTLYNEEEKNTTTGEVILPAGSRVTDTFGPARLVALNSGEQVNARPHTRTTYDEGAPNGGINPATAQRYSLSTTQTSGVTDNAATVNAVDLEVHSTTKTEYGKLTPTDLTEGDGWALGAATRTTTVNPSDTTGNSNIVTTTRYDTMGRVTDTRKPEPNGADTAVTKTAYYTVAAQASPNAACGGRPEWAGLTCRTYPAAQPVGAPLPDSRTAAYSMWLKPTSEVETSGTTTRTTTTTYDVAERPVSSKVVASGLAGQSAATARPGTYTKYDPTTGQVTYTGVLNAAGTDAETTGRTTNTYDRWGRTLTQTGDAGTTTTSYDAAGRVASSQTRDTQNVDRGTTTYGYDGPGEHRGLTTSLTITRGGTAGTLTYGATYDADGNMTRQTMPGKITQVTTYDQGGEAVGLQYLGQVTPVTINADGSQTPGTPVQDQPWLTWSTVNDAAGRARFEATGTGAAFDDGTGVTTIDDVQDWTANTAGQASSYGREYRYDFAGRLTHVQDAASTLDTNNELVATCTTRAYTFDKNGRRTHLATTTRDSGDCAATGTTTTAVTTGYDAADRPTTGKGGTGSYVYDTFGRQTTLPAVDAPTPGKGDITLGYFDDDQPRSVTQGDTSTTFTLDANGRRSIQTTIDPVGTTTTTRRYTDDSDNPAWTETTTGQGSSVTRFTESLGGDLSATINEDGGLSLSLSNPHGDVVTGVDIPAAQTADTSAITITGWATYDEYGNKASTSDVDAVDGPLGYGWLGAKQRSTTVATAGLTLMGVRFYNGVRGLFTSLDPVPGGNDNAYNYPNDPINQFDLDGKWSKRKWLRRGILAAGFIGALACGASIVCGIGVGAAAGFGAYAARYAGTRRWRWKSAGKHALVGGAAGFGWGGSARALGWRFGSSAGKHASRARGLGVRFSHGRARGTDFLWGGRRVFGLHSHRIPGRSRLKFIHYHRRGPGGIGAHRPWDRGRW